MINPELTNVINEYIKQEFGASMQYLCNAAYFHPQMLASHAEMPPYMQPRGVRIMGVIGPLARHVHDLELAFTIIAGADGRDRDVPPVPLKQEALPSFQGLRIAWTPAFPGVPVASEIRQAIEGLAVGPARQGSCVEEGLPEVNFAQQKALCFELLNDVMAVFQPLPEGAEPISMASYLTALHQRDSFTI